MCSRKFRVHLQHCVELLDRLIVSARVVVNESDIAIDRTRQRLSGMGQLDLAKRLIGPSGRKQESRQPLMSRCVRRVERDGMPKLPLCAVPVPSVIELDVTQ